MLRGVAVLIGLVAAFPALAGEQLSAHEARRFVIGKVFSYNCFEGTRGQGRVFSNGAVVGSIQFQGAGRTHYASLPAGTLQVKGERVCATLRGLPFEPCFNLEKTDENSFVGSISGLGFASCTFKQRHGRPRMARSRVRDDAPVALRPSLTAENN